MVLSGALTRDGRIGEGALTRLVGGIAELRAGVSSELILTRLVERHGDEVLRSDADQVALTRRLLPSARLHLVGPARNTRAEAVAVADLARREGWRHVVATAVTMGIPVPATAASLAYFDSYRTARLPANLIQGQRDYFGAHTYERTDKSGAFHTEWLDAAIGNGKLTSNPIAGASVAGSVITAVIVPASVVGSTAPQGGAFAAPSAVFLVDRRPANTIPTPP